MTDERIRVRTVYFVDEEPGGKPLDEYRLAFGPDLDGPRVLQCTEPGWIDEDAVLVVLEEGDAVRVADGNLHQTVRCQLYPEEWLDRVDEDLLDEYRVIDVPPELSGVNIPEVEGLDDNQMAPFNLSINMARAADGEGESGAGGGGGSIWRWLGKKSRRLF